MGSQMYHRFLDLAYIIFTRKQNSILQSIIYQLIEEGMLKNYLDNDNAELLLDFLSECDNIEFCFANKIVDNLVVE